MSKQEKNIMSSKGTIFRIPQKEKCMELFLIDSDTEKILTVTENLQSKNMDVVKLAALKSLESFV